MPILANGTEMHRVFAGTTEMKLVYAGATKVFQYRPYWEGSSLSGSIGLEDLGEGQYRFLNGAGSPGATITPTYNTLGSGSSINGGFGFTISGNTLTYVATVTVTGVISWTLSGGFTGSSTTSYLGITAGFQTSGGKIRWHSSLGGDGPYVAFDKS